MLEGKLFGLMGAVAFEKAYIFYGKKGSGKTSNATAQILHFVRLGLPVWVNFPIVKLPVWTEKYNPIIYRFDDPSDLLDMRGGLMVLDEAYLKVNSRKWADLPPTVFEAFTHARKLKDKDHWYSENEQVGMTTILIAQSWKRIDLSLREVTDFAREYDGRRLLGLTWSFTEYEVNEVGDIIKSLPSEYEDSRTMLALLPSGTQDAFDTDHLFTGIGKKGTWKSAILPPAQPEPAQLLPFASAAGPSWWNNVRAGAWRWEERAYRRWDAVCDRWEASQIGKRVDMWLYPPLHPRENTTEPHTPLLDAELIEPPSLSSPSTPLPQDWSKL